MTESTIQHPFRHCPSCGRPGPTGTRPLVCDGCGFTYFVNPTVAVGAVVEDADGNIVLIRRARDPGRGMLALPGGFVDPGETAEQALRRELREEIGLSVDEVRYVSSHPNTYRYRDVEYAVLDLFFFTRALGELRPDRSEVSGIVRVPVGRLDPDELAFESMRAAVRVFFARQRS